MSFLFRGFDRPKKGPVSLALFSTVGVSLSGNLLGGTYKHGPRAAFALRRGAHKRCEACHYTKTTRLCQSAYKNDQASRARNARTALSGVVSTG
ncbi:MAG TPA: hypothetical protein PLE21_06935, partial [Giesbergeria sp.]|nr:hypothetical protein [Giesbergeria sp.]